MKKLTLILAGITSIAHIATAQVSKNDFLYSPFTFGVYGGGTMLKGDVPINKISGAGKVSFDYNFSPYLSVGLEGQYGRLIEGKKENVAAGALYNQSAFGAVSVNARMAAGQIFKRSQIGAVNIARRFYMAAGVGYIRSHVMDINRGPQNLAGADNGNLFVVPTNVGIDIPLAQNEIGKPTILLNLNYQFNFVMSDDLDGFNYTSSFNHANDAYTLFSIGLKFSLGKSSDDMHK